MKCLITLSLLIVLLKTINCNLNIETINDNIAKIDNDKLRIIESRKNFFKNFTSLKFLRRSNLTGGYIDLDGINIDGLVGDKRKGRTCLKNTTKCMDESKSFVLS